MYKNYEKKNIENASFFRLPRKICFQINRKRERERERERERGRQRERERKRVREGMKRMREKKSEIEGKIAWKRKNQEDKK